MKIELSSPTHLRITWPIYSSEIDQEIRRRLSTVPGIEAGRGRAASAPVIQLARLMDLFPKSAIGYAALSHADTLGRRFYDSLVCLHIALKIDASGAVCAVGDNVSPLIEQLVAERSHALKPFVTDPPARSIVQQPEQPSTAHLYSKPRRAKKER